MIVNIAALCTRKCVFLAYFPEVGKYFIYDSNVFGPFINVYVLLTCFYTFCKLSN